MIIPDDAGRIQFHYVLIDVRATYERGEVAPGSDVLDARWARLTDIDTLDMADRLCKLLAEIRDKEVIVKRNA